MPARLTVVTLDDGATPLERLGQRILAMPKEQRRLFLASRTRNERAICEYALGAVGVGWRADPIAMASHLDRTFQARRYHFLLSAAFRRLADGIEPRQMWMLPARYGKSYLGSQWGPAWAIDRDPTSNWILNSYGDDLADENAGAVRNILLAHGEHLQARLRPDRKRRDRWATSEGGGILASGIGGAMIGFGAGGGLIGAGGGIIIDDPFKNWIEAHSPAARERVWNHYRAVLRTRLNSERAAMLSVGTRWHPDDLNGRILRAMRAGDEDDWTVYRLPAIAEAPDLKADEDYLRQPDLLGRDVGEVLDSAVFDAEEVAARHRVLGAYLTAGMEQQRPAPEEGGEIKRAWWRFGTVPGGTPDDALTSWDMKMKDKEGGDYVVGGVWHRYASTAWLVDFYRGQFTFTQTKAAIALACIRNPGVTRHVIENTGNGPEVRAALRRAQHNATVDDHDAGLLGMNQGERDAVEALMRRGIPGLVPENPEGDKVTRARTYSAPYIQAGDVWLPTTVEYGWGLTVVNEHATFPRGTHDDIVDMTSQALKHLLGRAPGTTSVPTGHIRRPGQQQVRLPAYRR